MLGFFFDTWRFGTCFFLRGGKCFNQMFRGRGYGAGGVFALPQSGKYVFFQFTHHLKTKTVGFCFDTGYPLSEAFILASPKKVSTEIYF